MTTSALFRVFCSWSVAVLGCVPEYGCYYARAEQDTTHNATYWQGGDEARRKECDLGFFKAIIADIDQTQKTVFSVLWYTILALVFYYAVRIGGRSYFNYTS